MVIRADEIDLTSDDLAEIAALFGARSLSHLGGFENLMLKSDPPGLVVRVSHSSRRSPELIEGEFEFVEHLSKQGVPAVTPVKSRNGGLVEAFETVSGESLLVACMEEAPGTIRYGNRLTDSEIVSYGEMLGAMHSASEGLVLDGGSRPSWDDHMWDVVPREDVELWRVYSDVKAAAANHPAGGIGLLIHQDAHLGNIHVTDDGRFTIFDFDDCGYGTATHDVAIVLFYWTMGFPGDVTRECRRFFSAFLSGYGRHAHLPSDWEDGVDLFLKLREADIYALLKDEYTPSDDEPGDEPADELEADPWAMEARFFQGRRELILEGAPFLGQPLGRILN